MPISDSEKLQNLFDGWSFARGYNSYFKTIQKGLPELTDETRTGYLPVRNIFTCESHCDMMKNVLRMIEEGRMTEAEKYWEEVRTYMLMDF